MFEGVRSSSSCVDMLLQLMTFTETMWHFGISRLEAPDLFRGDADTADVSRRAAAVGPGSESESGDVAADGPRHAVASWSDLAPDAAVVGPDFESLFAPLAILLGC